MILTVLVRNFGDRLTHQLKVLLLCINFYKVTQRPGSIPWTMTLNFGFRCDLPLHLRRLRLQLLAILIGSLVVRVVALLLRPLRN